MKNRTGHILLGGLLFVGACVLQSETVQGTKGDKGDKGEPGAVDATALAELQAKIDALQAKVDALEKQQPADPECPAGYDRDPTESVFLVCTKGSPAYDEVVKVGAGGSAFWIDRYEASVWEHEDGTGNRYFKDSDNDHSILNAFPKSGQWKGTAPPAYALSKAAVLPSVYITWFQASTACRASGKRLPTGDEWLEAARDTPDPPTGNLGLSNNLCNTLASGPRATGGGTGCRSASGAEDMVGNVWEWTVEWYAGLGNKDPDDPDNSNVAVANRDAWPYGNGDGTWNIASSVYSGNSGFTPYVPAAAARGGSLGNGERAGVLAFDVEGGPSTWGWAGGFRCVVPR